MTHTFFLSFPGSPAACKLTAQTLLASLQKLTGQLGKTGLWKHRYQICSRCWTPFHRCPGHLTAMCRLIASELHDALQFLLICGRGLHSLTYAEQVQIMAVKRLSQEVQVYMLIALNLRQSRHSER